MTDKTRSTWNLGNTKTIRVPVVIADAILKIARRIDELADMPSELTMEDREELKKF